MPATRYQGRTHTAPVTAHSSPSRTSMAPAGSSRRPKNGVGGVIELAREQMMAPDQTAAERPDGPVPAVLLGDESDFAAAAERYRRELHVHCYRMLAAFEEAEDAVQETFLRAWRGRDSFDGS